MGTRDWFAGSHFCSSKLLPCEGIRGENNDPSLERKTNEALKKPELHIPVTLPG
jgi:hypothetical protein